MSTWYAWLLTVIAWAIALFAYWGWRQALQLAREALDLLDDAEDKIDRLARMVVQREKAHLS